jgi:hypothetical protein
MAHQQILEKFTSLYDAMQKIYALKESLDISCNLWITTLEAPWFKVSKSENVVRQSLNLEYWTYDEDSWFDYESLITNLKLKISSNFAINFNEISISHYASYYAFDKDKLLYELEIFNIYDDYYVSLHLNDDIYPTIVVFHTLLNGE